jgi:hypothetical protein
MRHRRFKEVDSNYGNLPGGLGERIREPTGQFG